MNKTHKHFTTDQTNHIDNAGRIIGDSALRVVANHPRMTAARIDDVIAAMKAATPRITSQLIDDMTAAPTVSQYALKAAILELAQVGILAI